MLTPPEDSRAIVVTELEQFGGAERSIVALSRWLYDRGMANHVVTYFDHCGLARYADHPMEVIALNPGPGPRNKIAALRGHFGQRQHGLRPLLSGYQTA